MTDLCFFDLETRSAVDLRKHGLWPYAEDRSTCVTVLAAYWPKSGLKGVWAPEEFCFCEGGELEPNHEVREAWDKHVRDGGFCVAWNAQFDRRVLAGMDDRRAGARVAPAAPSIQQTLCAQAQAENFNLPGGLGKAADTLKSPMKKLTTGKRLIGQLADATIPWDPDLESLQAFWDYALADVLAMYEVWKRCRKWSGREWHDYHVVEAINEEGIPFDFEWAETAIRYAEREVASLNEELEELTGVKGITLSNSAMKRDWLHSMVEGSPLESSMWVTQVRKGKQRTKGLSAAGAVRNEIRARLAQDVSATWDVDAKRILTFLDLLDAGNGVATKKFQKALDLGYNGRIRHQYRCSPTQTGRHASRGVQFDNVIRLSLPTEGLEGLGSPDAEHPALFAIDTLMEGAETEEGMEEAADRCEEVFDLPINKVLARTIRPSIMAPPEGPETHIVWGDWSAIEARTLPWLAEAEEALEPFRRGEDVYCQAAEAIFSRPWQEIRAGYKADDPESVHQRSVGKVACIAEGELVLTDAGLIPIEKVCRCHRVWDGVEWVHHDGIVDQGVKAIITWDGLTATPDHRVHTASGWMALGEAARREEPISRTGHGRAPIRAQYGTAEVAGGQNSAEGVEAYPRTARVYDILNAGPRHRFTVSNRLVHNCLSLGFGGGMRAFQNLAAGYDVSIPDAMAEQVKVAWRAKERWAPRFWNQLDSAAWSAMRNQGVMFKAGKVTYFRKGDTLYCVLPCGRPICYPEAKMETKYKEAWEKNVDVITYRKMWQGQPMRGEYWGGHAAENVTQSAAASLLRDLLRRLHALGCKIIGSTHDEVRILSAKPEEDVAMLEREMVRVPEWAAGLPLKTECAYGTYYGKS